MKEIVVISGKGGTGKTSITASFSIIGGNSLIVGDCDVDADDMHLLLEPDFGHSEDFYSGFTAVIDNNLCTECGKCSEVCRFGAVEKDDGKYSILFDACEGCGYCHRVCPSGAIRIEDALAGKLYISEIKTSTMMVHARLNPGADNSGKLVAKVKKEAGALAEKYGRQIVLIDGPPGTGCPVISSLTGADYAVFVTEPTMSGLHDLKRVHELSRKFRLRASLVINKSDLNNDICEQLRDFARGNDIQLAGEIEYNEDFSKAIVAGKTIVEYDSSGTGLKIKTIWNRILADSDKGDGK